MDNREREALRELTEAARGFIDGKPKTLRRLRNATTEAERALGEARAAIEGEPPVGGTLGLDGDTKRDWETDGPALEKRVKELEAAAPLPTAREDALAKEIIRVNKYPEKYPITKAEGWHVLVDMAEKELVAPQPVSEGQLREARVLPIQWRNIADAKPSSFEFATRDDAFRYCADELERTLESA